MDWQAEIDEAGAIPDPGERARALSDLLGRHQAQGRALAGARRDAINQALASAYTRERLAGLLGVSGPRISQMRRAEPTPAVITGWAGDDGSGPAPRIAVCGSRADGAAPEHIDAAVPALAALLMRRRYAVSHGPVGVGAEVITYIADTWHPDGLDAVRGIIGHPAVVRDADYMVIVGGGRGTQAEVTAAISGGKRLLPMPASGGTAARVYLQQRHEPGLREWMDPGVFSGLATADAARFADLAETAIDEGESG